MADKVAPEVRSAIMRQIKGTDTQPELAVRRLVHSLGYRYRLHAKDLPGCPDLVFRKKKKAIFVHGCFWHQHNCRVGRRQPKSRREYWLPKLQGNVHRDKENRRKLKEEGWKVLIIWECQVKNKSTDWLKERIVAFLEG